MWSMKRGSNTISDCDVTTYVYERDYWSFFRCHLNTTWGEKDSESAIAPMASRDCSFTLKMTCNKKYNTDSFFYIKLFL